MAIQNNFIKDFKTLVLRHLDSGSLEILAMTRSTKQFLTSKMATLNQFVCNRFGSNPFTKRLNLILIAL